MKSLIGRLYNSHFIRYIFVGGTTLLIDISLLVLLHGVMKINVSVATTISYWTSILYNFVMNRWWTFNVTETRKLYSHIFAYAMLLGFNYIFTLIFVTIGSSVVPYWMAKLIAVGCQILWTYPIYKLVIFRAEPAVITSEAE